MDICVLTGFGHKAVRGEGREREGKGKEADFMYAGIVWSRALIAGTCIHDANESHRHLTMTDVDISLMTCMMTGSKVLYDV
jgi:hypothetical protein